MAKKIRTVFFCSSCGHESAKWVGQCPACREWNTMTEAPAPDKSAGAVFAGQTPGFRGPLRKPVPLSAVEENAEEIVGALQDAFFRHIGETPLSDDASFLCLQRRRI